jgi:hypothetical protein
VKYFLIILILCSSPAASFVAGQDTEADIQTSLTINVTNRTPNGTEPVNDEVYVNIYEQGKLKQTLEGSVDSQGKAVFRNVPTGGGLTAVPVVKHQNMAFNGHPVALNRGQTAFVGHVDVFEVSTDKTKLSVTVHHLIIKLETNHLRITEYMQLNNASDTAITDDREDKAEKSKVIEVYLPRGFGNLVCSRYFRQNALVITEDGFHDTMAIPPGTFDAEFSYTLPIDSQTIGITKEISLPTSALMVFPLLDKGQIKGLGRPEGQIKLADGSSAKYFIFRSLEAGQKLEFQLDGLIAEQSNNTILIVAVVAFAVIALFVVRRLMAQKSYA